MTKLAIFDFDGTVADSLDWFFQIVNQVARKNRFREITAAERDMLRDRGSREIMSYLGVPAWKLPLIARDVRNMAARDIAQIRIFPWVADIFSDLRRRETTIAIVSSNSESNIKIALGANVAGLVQHYAGGAAMFGKGAKIRGVVKRSAAASESAASIGDEVRDVEAARAAGISSIAVTWGYASATALQDAGPTLLVRDPSELVKWFAA
jgi:phosphoglycolate phosphatase